MIKRYQLQVTGAFLIALLATLLYAPFLSNGIVFDDNGLFATGAIFDLALVPFGWRPRIFPYFTLGLVHVLTGSIAANRIVSLLIHILAAWTLYSLLFVVLEQTFKTARNNHLLEEQNKTQSTVLAFIGATWFALNPVAVYGAGYLAQRTILFATLFSLLSLWFYRRALAKNRTADVITAALFYSAAVFSKEHAIMLPLAVVALSAIFRGDLRLNIKRAILYLLLCIPAAVNAVLTVQQILGSSYEPDANALVLQSHNFSMFNSQLGQWLVSISTQMGLFFSYLGYWIVPDIHTMSVDMRIDFEKLWMAWWWSVPTALLFISCPVLSLYALRRGGWAALFGLGLLYSWLLFLTELVSVRLQEPFVLYRSYLWAPGYMLMLVALCRNVSIRLLAGACIPLFAIFFWLACERLTSLTNEETVWKDAATKLESKSILGSDRILYNRGREYAKEKKYEAAIADFSHVLISNPTRSQIYVQRGLAYFSLNETIKAQHDFNKALSLSPSDGQIQFARGLVYERLGCFDEAMSAYSASLALGYSIAKIKVENVLQQKPKSNSFCKTDIEPPTR